MSGGFLADEDPDRLYTVTGGRSRAPAGELDIVTLIVSECEPVRGMSSEQTVVLGMCRHPAAVVEIAARLRMPVSVTKIIVGDLIDSGMVTARHPTSVMNRGLPRADFLEKVLSGLRNL